MLFFMMARLSPCGNHHPFRYAPRRLFLTCQGPAGQSRAGFSTHAFYRRSNPKDEFFAVLRLFFDKISNFCLFLHNIIEKRPILADFFRKALQYRRFFPKIDIFFCGTARGRYFQE
jgi:hypothetical protein